MKITLATLPTASAQQVFDHVATHLLAQNALSRLETGKCAYRGVDGRMCAVGCLIADEEYRSDFEYESWATLSHRLNVTAHDRMLRDLQFIHDQHNPDQWAYQLRGLARCYGLNADAIQ